jgi:hypothetical protein
MLHITKGRPTIVYSWPLPTLTAGTTWASEIAVWDAAGAPAVLTDYLFSATMTEERSDYVVATGTVSLPGPGLIAWAFDRGAFTHVLTDVYRFTLDAEVNGTTQRLVDSRVPVRGGFVSKGGTTALPGPPIDPGGGGGGEDDWDDPTTGHDDPSEGGLPALPPASWDDPRFATNTLFEVFPGKFYDRFVVFRNKDFIATPDNGDPAVNFAAGCKMINCRVKGREGPRVGGPGNYEFVSCYITAEWGDAGDHADGLQAYCPGAAPMIRMDRSTLRMTNALGQFSNNAGLFLADDCQANVTLTKCIFDGSGCPHHGGMFLANVPGDHGVATIRANDVQLFKGWDFTGPATEWGPTRVLEWTNVRDGDSGAGVPVPGEAGGGGGGGDPGADETPVTVPSNSLTVPTGYGDARYATNTAGAISFAPWMNFKVFENKDFIGSPASSEFIMKLNHGCQMINCRLTGRQGIRIAGPGVYSFYGCYIEIGALIADDGSRGLWANAPNAVPEIKLTGCWLKMIVPAGWQNAAGLECSNGSKVKLTLKDCHLDGTGAPIHGALYMVRVPSDAGVSEVSLENVKLTAGYDFLGSPDDWTGVVTKWVNVTRPDQGNAVVPSPAPTIPSGWDDPIFAATTPFTPLPEYTFFVTIQDKTIDIPRTNGDPALNMSAGGLIERCRIRGREGPRVGGSGTYTFRDCYFEAASNGTPEDHADAMQAYCPGAAPVVVIERCHIRTVNIEGENNCAVMFVDNAQADLTIKDSLFDGTSCPYHGAFFIANVPGDHGVAKLSATNLRLKAGWDWVGSGSDYAGVVTKWTNVTKFEDGTAVPAPGT